MVSVDYSFIIDEMQFSYSRLTSFEMCRQQWLLNYIFHEPKQSGFFAEYGSFMHSILEQHLRGELSRENAILLYLCEFDNVIQGRAPNAKIRNSFFVQGVDYLKTLDFPHKKIIAVEDEVEFKIDGYDYIGYVDVLSEDDGVLAITDHKSHPLYPFSRNYMTRPTEKDKDLLSYLRQQILYAYGVKQKYGRYPDMLEFNSYRKQTFVRIPFSEDMLEPTISWAKETRNRISENTNWKPTIDQWVCNNLCDVNRSCPYYQMCGGRALG